MCTGYVIRREDCSRICTAYDGKGVYVVAFSYPVVPKGKARIRTQVCASHTKEDIDFIVKCFKEVREEMGLNK